MTVAVSDRLGGATGRQIVSVIACLGPGLESGLGPGPASGMAQTSGVTVCTILLHPPFEVLRGLLFTVTYIIGSGDFCKDDFFSLSSFPVSHYICSPTMAVK